MLTLKVRLLCSRDKAPQAQLALEQMVQAGHRWYQCNPRAQNSAGELVEPQLRDEFLALAAAFYASMD